MVSSIKKYVLSPCGTSLLTNGADKEERGLISTYANKKTRNELPDHDRRKLESLIKKISDSLQTADNKNAMRLSAELNGIIKIYDGQIQNNHDIHFLLSTDTWLGEKTAELVKTWLKCHSGLIVEVYRQINLQTAEISAFQQSLSNLVKKMSEDIPTYQHKGYKIIFNLTGGFKSVQGFLQSIANFYADETVYVFETSDKLLRIPKLPVRMDVLPYVRDKFTIFRQLSLDIPVRSESLVGIPETLLFEVDDQIALSPWGGVLWEQSKKQLYSTELYEPPIDRIQYSKGFEKDTCKLEKDRIPILNRKMDQLAEYLLTGKNPRSLDLKPIRGGKMAPSTYEIDAWSDQDAKRIFGHYSGNIFILDKLDKGLH